MDRVQHASAAPGNLFTEGDPGTGTPATTVTDTWLNHIQEELALLVEYAGLTLSAGDDEQVRKAIETLSSSGRAGTTTNTADAYLLATTPNPSFDALIAGMVFFATINSTNAGAATLNTNGSGVKPIVHSDGTTDLGAGDIVATKTSIFMYDGTSYRLLNPAGGVGDLIAANNLSDVDNATTSRANLGLEIDSDVEAYDAANAKTDIAQEYTATQNFNATTLADATTIAWDAAANQVASVTLTANRTLGAPTNLVDGAIYVLTVIQDAGGTNTLAYNAIFDFGAAGAPDLTTDGDAEDVLTFKYNGTKMQGVINKGFGL